MMALQEAIAHAKEKAKELNDTADNWKRLSDEKGLALPSDYEPCKECASEHEQLAAWLTELQERREADRWIPVSERLPDTNDNVLAYDGSDMFVAWYENNDSMEEGWHSFDIAFGELTPVIAWRPLPEPYKESEAESLDNQRAVEDTEYCERHEPTYNPDDGSM